jgi:hypothetical protein
MKFLPTAELNQRNVPDFYLTSEPGLLKIFMDPTLNMDVAVLHPAVGLGCNIPTRHLITRNQELK